VSAIRILEPIAEEILNLSKLEENQSSAPNNPKFNFTLEKRNLSTVHLNAITRIYGEHGPEILELLRKNPAGTIPVVLRRLKQKDLEWRKARQELNKQWKETMEKNYDKSFDHRSFYFKQQDKRTYSVKHLVADIKGGNTGLEAGSALNDIAPAGVSLTLHADLSHLLLRGSALPMTPQLVLSFTMQDVTIHGDIYQLFSHIAESNPSIPVYDRERMTACWRDWLRPLFQIPTYLLYPPSSTTAVSSTGNVDAIPVDASEAWTPGTSVLTIFGTAKVVSFRAADSMYEVMLPYGRGYLKNSAIIGAEELSSQALAAVGINRDPATGVDKLNGSTFAELAASSNHSAASPAMLSEPSTIFYGTQNSYSFLRVYHTLYTRLAMAKQLAYEAAMSAVDAAAQESAMEDGSYTMQADLEAKSAQLILLQGAQSKYSTYLSQLLCLLDGSLELSRYEEAVRQLLGNKAYVLYTMDKVLQQALKMFQGLTNDDNFNRLIGIFVYQRSIANTTVVASAQVTSNSSAPSTQSTSKKSKVSKSAAAVTAVTASIPTTETTSSAVGGRRAVNVMYYFNHVKQMTAFGYEDLYRFQVRSPCSSYSVTVRSLSCSLVVEQGRLCDESSASDPMHQ
jgi:paired amphipathic helix protein Sin3a